MEFYVVNSLDTIILWGAISAIALALLVRAAIPILAKLSVISLTFFLLYSTVVSNVDLLGRPLDSFPTEKFIIIYYTVDVTNTGDKMINTWVREGRDMKHRLYRFPWSEQTEQQLKSMGENAADGQVEQGEFVIPPNEGSEEDGPEEMVLRRYPFPYQLVIPKGKAPSNL